MKPIARGALPPLALCLWLAGAYFSLESPAAVAACHATTGAAPAAETLPAELKIPRYAPGPIAADRLELSFRASWLGIPAADASVSLEPSPVHHGEWTGEARISTNRFIDLFFRMRDYLREDFDQRTLAPRDLYIRQLERRRLNEFTVDFDRQLRLVTCTKRNSRGSETRRFASDNPAGPLSGAMMALSQPLEVGQSYTFDVFSGRRRYVMEFRVAARERLKLALGSFEALRIVPRIIYNSDPASRKEAHDTELWVTATQPHLPLRIQAAAFVGSVRADLVKIAGGRPDTAPPPSDRLPGESLP